jgi:hypothetical protein
VLPAIVCFSLFRSAVLYLSTSDLLVNSLTLRECVIGIDSVWLDEWLSLTLV